METKMNWTVESLRAFEQEIAEIYNSGLIRAPVHLSGGNEQQLIEYFADHKIGPQDWVCTTWRSHYHCLLKGIPLEKLKADILAGKSITLTYPEQRVISSAIVGGIIPIGLGIAKSIKLNNGTNRVFVFVGDMTSLTGIFYECVQYASNFKLPIHFLVENNGLSVCTNTEEAWGLTDYIDDSMYKVEDYSYKLTWPHAGAGIRVQF